jgi:WD40 repeat protein
MTICRRTPAILNFDGKISTLDFPKAKGGLNGLISTTAGTIWYVDWSERVNIILNSWHNTFKKTIGICFNEKSRKIITSSTDFSIKLWNTGNHYEEEVDFFIANKVCTCMDTEKSIMAGGFTDGTIRVYELINNTLLGYIEVRNAEDSNKKDAISSIKFFKNGLNLLVGTFSGRVYMTRIHQHIPLKMSMTPIADTQFSITSLDLSPFDHRYVWLCSSKNNLLKVWGRKNLYRSNNDKAEEDLMTSIQQMEFY